VTFPEVRTDLVILTCAISAGIHAALVPDHLEEGTGAGLGFLAAALLLAVLAFALTQDPTRLAFGATGAVFVGLITSYALAATIGFPLLHPEPEAVDGLALITKAVEGVGLVLCASVFRPPLPSFRLTQPKGTPT
jgi:hypothetical protein